MVKTKAEILAPAGGQQALVAAVRSGADAVYLGGKVLNARNNAGNFDEDELTQAVSYCHERGVKVYLTLNTAVYDHELTAAARLIEQAANNGVDALIVSDIGVASLASKLCPEMPLHASTQLSVHSLSGAQAAKKLGFGRVVMAREMSHLELAQVIDGCDIQTEVFVHGALCMSVSGQCYLSSMIGQRSGNRGRCAQPCRLPFAAGDKNGYHLSLKDLSLIRQARELSCIGITSLKIEGRMKRPEYVAAAVTCVRQALDGQLDERLYGQLEAVFSRSGFTKGYYTGVRDKTMFGIRTKEDVIKSQEVLSELSSLYEDERQSIPLRLTCTIHNDVPVTVSAEDNDANWASATAEPPQIAINKPTDSELVERQLSKLGGTPYYAQGIQCVIDAGLMVPLSTLNGLRREVIQKLSAMRQKSHPKKVNPLPHMKLPVRSFNKIPEYRGRFERIDQIPGTLADRLEEIILPLNQCVILSRNRAHWLFGYKNKLIAELPRGMFSRDERIEEQLTEIKKAGITQAMVENIGGETLAIKHGFQLSGGMFLNTFNSPALLSMAQRGYRDAVVSIELTLENIKRLGDMLPIGAVVYGYMPLMLTRSCPLWNNSDCKTCKGRGGVLHDRLSKQFAVGCDGIVSTVYNSVPIKLWDKTEDFLGLSFVTLYFTRETAEQCEQIAEQYLSGEQQCPMNDGTRGLYYRGAF